MAVDTYSKGGRGHSRLEERVAPADIQPKRVGRRDERQRDDDPAQHNNRNLIGDDEGSCVEGSDYSCTMVATALA